MNKKGQWRENFWRCWRFKSRRRTERWEESKGREAKGEEKR